MAHWTDIAALVLTAALLAPVAVLCVECLAALLARPRPTLAPTNRPPLAVLIPAHNEELGLPATLRSVIAQLLPHDRLVVVADNCTDRTAAVARAAGVTVIERHDADHRGKGYALDRGLRELESAPTQVLVMIDADCSLAPNALTALAAQVIATNQPAQAAYVMDCPRAAGPRASISAFAFIVKNVVRPLGLHQLHLPCLLTGTGMAFPWAVIRHAPLASGNIVEDMQLGLDLAIAGHAPRACPGALVHGTVERQSSIAYKQRTRWEHGHLQTLLVNSPRLLAAALRQRSPRLLALALEVAVPPITLLVLGLLIALSLSITYALTGGSPLPAFLLAGGCATLLFCTLAAWFRFARAIVPFRALVAIPLYVAWKIPLYSSFLVRREKQWIRTARHGIAVT